MPNEDKPTPAQTQPQPTPQGAQAPKTAPPLGTDTRPVQPPANQAVAPNSSPETTENKLGKDATGATTGENMGEENQQPPTQNATAGGPDAGQTPANEPGMSHP